MSCLKREVQEEIGLTNFHVERLLTIAEALHGKAENSSEENSTLHKLDIVYQCQIDPKPTQFTPIDEQEVGPKGIRWVPIAELTPGSCSSRAWKALQAASLVPNSSEASQD